MVYRPPRNNLVRLGGRDSFLFDTTSRGTRNGYPVGPQLHLVRSGPRAEGTPSSRRMEGPGRRGWRRLSWDYCHDVRTQLHPHLQGAGREPTEPESQQPIETRLGCPRLKVGSISSVNSLALRPRYAGTSVLMHVDVSYRYGLSGTLSGTISGTK
jgi:hypothetical protein